MTSARNLAQDARGESFGQAGRQRQGLFHPADLVGGEALGLEGGMVDARGVGEAAGADQGLPGDGRIDTQADQPVHGRVGQDRKHLTVLSFGQSAGPVQGAAGGSGGRTRRQSRVGERPGRGVARP